jgi:phospholipase C
MRNWLGFFVFMFVGLCGNAQGQISSFEHIIVIVQENRTPDNMFYALCTAPGVCSTNPTDAQYDIKTAGWLNAQSSTGVTKPLPEPLADNYDMGHRHLDFTALCDAAPGAAACSMDGEAANECETAPKPTCPVNGGYHYVDNSTGILDSDIALVTQYGWANHMFQTNQGPSFPAHQFLFGATSAPSSADDHAGIFMSSDPFPFLNAGQTTGLCTAVAGTYVQLIEPGSSEGSGNTIYPCAEHTTLADLLTKAGFTWRYYASSIAGIWNAPTAIRHICVPRNGKCRGAAWQANDDANPADVFNDISNCNLRSVSWVTPSLANSDHAGSNSGGGPSWVASIVNSVGSSTCTDASGLTYWQTTAILVVWDDWGGWYDHVPPDIEAGVEGDYQMGFRVPLIFVSAYTAPHFIDNDRYDFGSIARFIENNFGMREGALGFADARSTSDFRKFYNFGSAARSFTTIPTPLNAHDFLNDRSPQLPPDDD